MMWREIFENAAVSRRSRKYALNEINIINNTREIEWPTGLFLNESEESLKSDLMELQEHVDKTVDADN